MNNNVILPKLC